MHSQVPGHRWSPRPATATTSIVVLALLSFLGSSAFAGAGLLAATPTMAAVPVARAGDGTVALHWASGLPYRRAQYQVERATAAGGPFLRVTSNALPYASFSDVYVTNDVTYRYRFVATIDGQPAATSVPVAATPRAFRTEHELLDLLQATAFDFFRYLTHPENGLMPDRSSATSPCSVASMGFGLSAIAIGIDHGWIGRAEGRQHVLRTLETLWRLPQGAGAANVAGHRGWFYHFLEMETGHRTWKCELSSVDTAWLLAGVVDVRQYFSLSHPEEREIRRLAQALIRRVDWVWMATGEDTLSHGWYPEKGFIRNRWTGYNEAMWLYILALGAEPKLSSRQWLEWTRPYAWKNHYGFEFIEFPPLFGHQYSHCWVDFRGRADGYLRARRISYFENSRRATLAQRQHCIENPGRFLGYGPNCWGLTACDGPGRPPYAAYNARGAPPAFNDDGTIAPTAAGGSIAFTPVESLAALRFMYDRYRARIWTPFGLCDAFNLSADWFGPDVIGIDQGPILLMIENHRTGRVWQRFMGDPLVIEGLRRSGIGKIASR